MRIEDVSHEAHAHRILVRLRYLIVAFSFIGLYLRFVDEIYIYIYDKKQTQVWPCGIIINKNAYVP